MTVENEDQGGTDYAEIEREAKSMGWVAEKDFRGNKSLWVDAEEFVEKGKHVIPIMRQNTERLKRELLTRDEKLVTLQTSLDNANVAIQKLETHYTAANKQAFQRAKDDLKAQLKAAREDDDVDAEFSILEKLDELKESQKPEVVTPPVKKETTATPGISPEFQAWNDENSWFGEDKKKTKAVIRIGEDLRDEGNTLTGVAFMEACMEEYAAQNPETPAGDPPTRQSKVEGGSSRGGQGGSGSKSFASLPQAAKEACWADADDLVGPTKRYKTQADWEKKYASIYYTE